MNIRPVVAELFHVERRTDVQTDMTKLIVAFLNFLRALKSDKIPTLASQLTKKFLSPWERGAIKGT